MNFISAVIAISKRPDLEFCEDETELTGIRSCICIYKDGEFLGKLRWPKDGKSGWLDEDLEKELNKSNA